MGLKYPLKVFVTLSATILIGFGLYITPKGVGGQGFGTPQYLPVIAKGYPTGTPTPRPAYILVTEVMYDPTGAEPEGEWIELYNPGSSAVDLTKYKVGDEEIVGGREGMMMFPPGAVLGAGDVIVIANRAVTFFQLYNMLPSYEMHETDASVPNLIKYSPWSGGNIELTNGGDEVLLLDGSDTVRDGLSWGNSHTILDPPVPGVGGTAHSLERIPANRDTDLAEDWIDQAHPSPGEVDTSTPTPNPTQDPENTPIPPDSMTLLISEVLYDPGQEPQGEWIELYNYGEAALSLVNVRLGDEETQGDGEGMLVFPPLATVEAKEAVIVANQATVFRGTFGFAPGFEMNDSDPAVPDMLKDAGWGGGSVNLSNTGDEVLLLHPTGQQLDGLSWGTSNIILNPPVSGAEPGHSIERYPPEKDTDTAFDWREQPMPNPGMVDTTAPTSTPTLTGTPLPTTPPVLVINEIHADPHLSLGDANGDGIIDPLQDEFLEIVNMTGAQVDLSGWRLMDLTGVRHTLPSGSVIMDQCALLIFGGGYPTGSFGGSLVQKASSGSLGLNNAGDRVSLADLSASIVISYTYGVEGGDDQSLTRYPDIVGDEPLIKHSTAPGSNGALFSPGLRSDGTVFSGCSLYKEIWIRRRAPAPAGSP